MYKRQKRSEDYPAATSESGSRFYCRSARREGHHAYVLIVSSANLRRRPLNNRVRMNSSEDGMNETSQGGHARRSEDDSDMRTHEAGGAISRELARLWLGLML